MAVLSFRISKSRLLVLASPGGGGGHVGIFWVGMCRPGLQIGTPFWKKFPLKLIPRSRSRPKNDTPF